jgi:large conductance mechanosensitive channel
MRGNVIDMAVGVIIATAFGKITTSLVNDVIMPAIGLLTSDGSSFTEKLNWTITGTETTIGFGLFLETIINFLIIGFSVFVMIKIINKVREVAEAKLIKKVEEEPVPEEPKGPTTEELLSEILAELKNK